MERHKPESRRPYCSTIHTYLTEPLLRCGDAFERGSELTEKPKCAGRHLTHTFCMCQLTDRHAQSKLSTAFVANSLGSCFTSIKKKIYSTKVKHWMSGQNKTIVCMKMEPGAGPLAIQA